MHPFLARFFSLGSALFLASTAALAQLQTLPAEGLAQIQAYSAEKLSRTPAEAKLSSQLLHAMRALAGQDPVPGIAPAIPGVQAFIADRVAADNTVQVTIRGDINDGLLASIAAAGGSEIDPYPQYGRVTARLPISALLDISSRDDVVSIRPLDRPQTNRYLPSLDERKAMVAATIAKSIPNGPIGNTGTSQGFHAHGADLAVNTGIDGTGVKICVLSDGVDSLATLQGAGELPAVDVVSGQAGSGDEGTAMLQIVHDMAPNAALGFATAFTSDASFAANIVTLRNSPHNCDIIVDDVTYFEEGAFQDGLIAQSVNTVTAAGALYFSSAANSGNITHATLAGTWEGDFVDGGAAGPPLTGAGHLHNFGGFTFDTLKTKGSVVILEWSDPLGASNNDYDLYILNAAGTAVLTSSTDVQSGSTDPVEGVACSVSVCPTNAQVVVVLFSGVTRALRVDTERGTMSIVTAGNTFGHNAAASAFTAAATNVANASGGLFTGGAPDPVETYSSDGPRKIFYNPNGTAITPGNVLFGTGGGTTLAKVDLTAADCVHSFVVFLPVNFDPFCGTSAAAPHAAAIAGLIKSAKSGLTNTQIKTALLGSALDIEAAGTDRDSGAGIVMAHTAVKSVLTPLTVGKSFVPNAIAPGGTSVLTITLNNPNTIAIKGVAFTDTYPANVVNSGTPNPNITGAGCTGTFAASAGGGNAALTAGTVPAGITCTYRVTVTSSVANTYIDGSGAVTTPITLNTAAASASLTVGTAPNITSANTTTFTVGVFGTFSVTATGSPTPAIARTAGALPTGVNYVDNGNGTGTLSGTATATAGNYPLTFTASNGVLPNSVQSFTLTLNVGAAASIAATGGASQSATVNTVYGSALQATVTDAGSNGVSGVNVAFNLPASGASGTFPGPTIVANVATNASGIATSPLITANGVVGAFTATATASALVANYSLYNVPLPAVDSGGRPMAAAGSAHTVFLFGDHTVKAVGANASGQLGDASNSPRTAPVPVSITNVLGVSAGSAHTLAVKNDGTAWAWGFNADGELGDTTNSPRNAPVQVSGLTNVMAVSAGQFHSLAVKRDGTVWTWGSNSDGQLGNGATGGTSSVPVQVKGVGGVGFLTGVTAVAGGGSHSCALKSDGTEVCWGRGAEGQLGNSGNAPSNVPVVVSGLSQVAQITAGDKHSVALLIDGTVKAWGQNGSNELGDNTTSPRNAPVSVLTAPATPLTGIAAIATGADHNLAISQTGAVFSWGAGGAGQLGSGGVGNRAVAATVDSYTNAIGVFSGPTASTSFVYHGRSPTQSYGQFQSFGQNPAFQLAQTSSGNKLVPADTAATVFSPLNTFRTCFSQCAGREDLFWRRSDGTNAVYFYINDTATSFTAAFPPGVDPSWTAMGTGDIDGDGISDVVWFQPSTGQVAIWKMSGSGNFAAGFFPASVGAGSGWQIQAIGDLDGDGSADILWRNTTTKEILVWFMKPDFTIDQAVSFGGLSLAWTIKGIGDIDGDWIRDIIFQHTDGTIAAWKLSPTGQFKSYFLGNVGASSGWQIAKIGDLDGDGRDDIFFRNSIDGTTAIWYLNGGSVAATQFTPTVPNAVWTLQAIGQFTQTNPPGQIVWTDSGGNTLRWQMTGRGGAPVVQSIGGIGTGWSVVR